MLSVRSGGTAVTVSLWLALLGAAAVVAVVLFLAVIAVAALRSRHDVPQVLFGLSHVISASCGLLPWGRPSVPLAPDVRCQSPRLQR
jgi:hypothetical protein